MSTLMQQLLNAYTVAVSNESMISNDEHASEKRYQAASEKTKVCRSNLIRAIEELEERLDERPRD